MKYKVIVVDGTGYEALTSFSFYKLNHAQAFCSEVSNTNVSPGQGKFTCQLWTGIDIVTYVDGNPV